MKLVIHTTDRHDGTEVHFYPDGKVQVLRFAPDGSVDCVPLLNTEAVIAAMKRNRLRKP
jgi:hypothetical protein